MNIRKYMNALRKVKKEWHKEYDSRMSGCRVVEVSSFYEYRNKLIQVQFWQDGEHRVSHMKRTVNGFAGDKYPTNFRTVDEMIKAIELQLSM